MSTRIGTIRCLLVVVIAGLSCTPPENAADPDAAAIQPASAPLHEWQFGRQPLQLAVGRAPFAWSIRVRAASEAAAQQLAEAVVDLGPGAETPAEVDVDLMLTADVTGGFLCLHSSMTGEFDALSLTLGEETLASLQGRSNVELTYPGQGWSTATMRLAPARIPPGTQAMLSQHRKGSPADRSTRFGLRF